MHLVSQVVDYLENRSAPSAVIGGLALAAHGVSRSTLDADLFTCDVRVLEADFWEDWEGVAFEILRGDLEDPLAGVVHFSDDVTPLDIIIGKEAWMLIIPERRTMLSIEGTNLPVANSVDLILLKLYAAGPQDLLDVELLLAGHGPELRKSVEDQLEGLPASLQKIWEKIQGA